MTRSRDDEQLPLSRTPAVHEDVEREIAFHLHERARELETRGVAPERARAIARDAFGDQAAIETECKTIEKRRRMSAKRSNKIEALVQDLRVGVRMLTRTPVFTFAAVLTLALGIGATAAVFSIVNRNLLQPLPYPNAGRLVWMLERHENGGQSSIPWSTFNELEQTAHSFDALTQYGGGTTTAITSSGPLRVRSNVVSHGFFKVFVVQPFMGRLPVDEDHRIGAPPVTVVSYAFWRDVLGSPKSLDGIRVRSSFDYAVVGVLPASFDFPTGNQMWSPMELQEQGQSHTSHNWRTIGLVRSGVTPSVAEHELDGLLAAMKPKYYPDFDATGSAVQSLQDATFGSVKTPLYLLLGASGILLLAACTNIASSLLARGSARSAEFAVRSALGATRVRLVRQLLTESGLLALVGCVAGLVFAWIMLRVLSSRAPATLRMNKVHIDLWVQLFALGVAAMTTVLFGLLPALRLSESNTTITLREAGGSRGSTAGGRRMLAWNVLVGAEVALAVTLLSGSALLISSFMNVMAVDLGFSTQNATVVAVDLPSSSYSDAPHVTAFHEGVLAALKATPGVAHVGFVNTLPLTGSNPNGGMFVEGKPPDAREPRMNGYAMYRVVGRGYFKALGIPLLHGRDFGDGDDLAGPPVTIVDAEFASKEWPGQDAIGKRVRVAGMDGGDEQWSTVIGVVGSTRTDGITSPFAETYFFDYRQRPWYRSRSPSYVVQSASGADQAGIMARIRDVVRAVDKNVPVVMQPMATLVNSSVADRRFNTDVLSTFAAVALILAIVGIYGVVSYVVAQRTREIGVRRALGATPSSVRRLVVGSSMKAIIPGLVAGAAMSIGTGYLLQSLLYGVDPFSATALAVAVGSLGAAAYGATLIPALRATRVDPMEAMRAE